MGPNTSSLIGWRGALPRCTCPGPYIIARLFTDAAVIGCMDRSTSSTIVYKQLCLVVLVVALIKCQVVHRRGCLVSNTSLIASARLESGSALVVLALAHKIRQVVHRRVAVSGFLSPNTLWLSAPIYWAVLPRRTFLGSYRESPGCTLKSPNLGAWILSNRQRPFRGVALPHRTYPDSYKDVPGCSPMSPYSGAWLQRFISDRQRPFIERPCLVVLALAKTVITDVAVSRWLGPNTSSTIARARLKRPAIVRPGENRDSPGCSPTSLEVWHEWYLAEVMT